MLRGIIGNLFFEVLGGNYLWSVGYMKFIWNLLVGKVYWEIFFWLLGKIVFKGNVMYYWLLYIVGVC